MHLPLLVLRRIRRHRPHGQRDLFAVCPEGGDRKGDIVAAAREYDSFRDRDEGLAVQADCDFQKTPLIVPMLGLGTQEDVLVVFHDNQIEPVSQFLHVVGENKRQAGLGRLWRDPQIVKSGKFNCKEGKQAEKKLLSE